MMSPLAVTKRRTLSEQTVLAVRACDSVQARLANVISSRVADGGLEGGKGTRSSTEDTEESSGSTHDEGVVRVFVSVGDQNGEVSTRTTPAFYTSSCMAKRASHTAAKAHPRRTSCTQAFGSLRR